MRAPEPQCALCSKWQKAASNKTLGELREILKYKTHDDVTAVTQQGVLITSSKIKLPRTQKFHQ